MTARLTIDIWSDVMCPWCVIGYKNLEAALAGLAGEIEAEIRWRPFELNPDMPPEGEDSRAHIARKYGRTPDQAAAASAMMAERARAAGFAFDFTGAGEEPPARMWNTFGAHKLLAWALAEQGADAQTRLQLALFAAHFRERRNVSDPSVLVSVAEVAGLDPAATRAALGDPALGEAVRAEERRALDQGITAVPAMILDGKFLVPGAQEPETYSNLLRRAAARRG